VKGKTILITGSTDGIGKQTALELARLGANVIIHGRDPQRLQSTQDELIRISGNNNIDSLLADFSSLAQVKQMASNILAKYMRLDVLVNNAGVFLLHRKITIDGLEMNFQVNYLAPFLLTNSLLPLLKKSAPARIVSVSSGLHSKTILDFENLQGEKNFNGMQAYALSKLGNIYMTLELAERLAGSGITANCLHPGGVDTKMLRTAMHMTGISVEEGAAPSVFLASSPDVAEITGKYFYHKEVGRLSEIASNTAAQKMFWQISEALLKDYL
jgi:NAD(P)-dependent dehydrogenase (short-subunit alcohol dehydrogenase family)